MPTRPAPPCRNRTCPNTQPCAQHPTHKHDPNRIPWENSTRRRRLPPNWEALRQTVARRAEGRCEHVEPDGRRCPKPGEECDHIDHGDNHALTNLQWLCTQHHTAKTLREAAEARRAKRDTHHR